MTLEGLHMAYDGMNAGIIIPNDLECHLKQPKNQNFYSHYYDEWYERETDYPSFGEMRYILHQKNIKVVYAVGKKVRDLHLLHVFCEH